MNHQPKKLIFLWPVVIAVAVLIVVVIPMRFGLGARVAMLVATSLSVEAVNIDIVRWRWNGRVVLEIARVWNMIKRPSLALMVVKLVVAIR